MVSIGAIAACGEDNPAPLEPEVPMEPDTVVTSIRVAPREQTVGVLGTEFAVRAMALNASGDTLYASWSSPGRFEWSSSAPEIATLGTYEHHRTGVPLPLVRTVAEGTATITATSQGLTSSMTVTVWDRARAAWSLSTGPGNVQSSVVIGADGTIYVVTTNHGQGFSVMFALSPGGGVLWTQGLPRTGRSTPAIGDDGTLYVGSWADSGFSGSLVAVGPGGNIRWVLDGLNAVTSSPAIGPDGTIYVAATSAVHAVNPAGEIEWTHDREERVFGASSPALGSDGRIYVGANDGLLYAFDGTDGSLRWTFSTGDVIASSPAIGADGTIYVGSMDGWLYAVNAEGTEAWRVEVDLRRGVSSSPSIGPDGTIYVGGDGVGAIDPAGSVRWHFRGSHVQTTPLLGADGNVYFATPGGVTALDSQGELLWAHGTQGWAGRTPAIGIDGTIIATSHSGTSGDAYEGTVEAFAETELTNGGHDGSPWPTMRGNRANTGRAGG
ncbi:MAG: hypothetical protein EA421_04100 [Gemmatimonadales bacterium]|nr:MAG: hypothetical protein EA421_04100 [Gemmatimonadales bacterium]